MKISNEAKVGALTAIIITILILGYNFLKGNDLFSSTNTFHAIYDNVDGLSKSNAVVINGYKVGQVVSVDMMDDKRLHVTLEVRSGIKISKFDTARIMANDLFNTKVINLTNCGIQPEAKENDTLVPFLQPGFTKMIGDALSPIKQKVENLVSVIDSAARGLKDAVGSGTGNQIAQSLNDIRLTLANLREMSGSLNNLVGDERSRLNQILSNVASISKNLKDNNEVLSKTLRNVKNITDSLAAADLKNTINQTKSTMAGLNEVVRKINSGEGSLGLLVNDKKLYDNLQNSASSLDKLLSDLKANPKRYLHFSVFGKKEKVRKN